MDTLLQQHEQSEENQMDEHQNSAYTIILYASRHGCPLPNQRVFAPTLSHINNTPCERTPNWVKFNMGSKTKQ
eukprot:11709829-Ditylum_brightwellii.AAC.1